MMEVKDVIAEAALKKDTRNGIGMDLLLLFVATVCIFVLVFLVALFAVLDSQVIVEWADSHKEYVATAFVLVYFLLLLLVRGSRKGRENTAMIQYLLGLLHNAEKTIPKLVNDLLENDDSEEAEAYKIATLKEKAREILLIKAAIKELEKTETFKCYSKIAAL
jgi:hypothetical protein